MKHLLFIAVLTIAVQVLHGHLKVPSYKQRAQVLKPQIIPENVPNKNGSSRIISGTQATRGMFPYMAGLYLDDRLFCGGTLISQRWVLTSASCAQNTEKFTVHLGAQNIYNENEEGHIIILTTESIIHHAFNATEIAHDIALVNLGQDVSINKFVQAIALSSVVTEVGTTTRISGWGKTFDASWVINPELMYTDVEIIGNDQCTKTYVPVIREFHICTKGNNKNGWCNGDTGGPLVDLSTGKLVGIASFLSQLGCDRGSPNGYTRVSYYACWIKANTGICS